MDSRCSICLAAAQPRSMGRGELCRRGTWGYCSPVRGGGLGASAWRQIVRFWRWPRVLMQPCMPPGCTPAPTRQYLGYWEATAARERVRGAPVTKYAPCAAGLRFPPYPRCGRGAATCWLGVARVGLCLRFRGKYISLRNSANLYAMGCSHVAVRAGAGNVKQREWPARKMCFGSGKKAARARGELPLPSRPAAHFGRAL